MFTETKSKTDKLLTSSFEKNMGRHTNTQDRNEK